MTIYDIYLPNMTSINNYFNFNYFLVILFLFCMAIDKLTVLIV